MTNKTFIESDTDEIIEFEKNLAYFYGAKTPETIAQFYMAALQQLENLGLHTEDEHLQRAMLKPLKEAYAEVLHQTQLQFDIDKAAHYEFQLILAQARMAPFETIYRIMSNLYQEVFHSNEIEVHKGAMLRTFLYKHKLSLLNKKIPLSEEDRAIMLSIAKSSENELNKLINLA